MSRHFGVVDNHPIRFSIHIRYQSCFHAPVNGAKEPFAVPADMFHLHSFPVLVYEKRCSKFQTKERLSALSDPFRPHFTPNIPESGP